MHTYTGTHICIHIDEPTSQVCPKPQHNALTQIIIVVRINVHVKHAHRYNALFHSKVELGISHSHVSLSYTQANACAHAHVHCTHAHA